MQLDVQMDKGIVVMFGWINSQMDNLSGESLKVFMLMSSLIGVNTDYSLFGNDFVLYSS